MRPTSHKKIRPCSVLLLFRQGRLIMGLLWLTLCLTTGARAQMRQVSVDSDADNDIQKISFYSPSEGFVAFTKWIGYTTDSGRTFTQKSIRVNNVNFNGFTNVNLTFGFGIVGVKAFAANNLLVYGNYGFVPAILRSTDQGNSFTLIYLSKLNAQKWTDGITSMVFAPNSNIGYASEADRIIKTTNKGETWLPVHTSANSFFDVVEAVDENNVYAYSRDATQFLRSFNGGNSWFGASVPAGKIKNIHFITASKGWVHMNDEEIGMLYYTSNGGISWTLKNDPAATPFNARKMKFINDSTGYALTHSFTVLKTTDSGRVWEPLPRENNFTYLAYEHNDIHFWDNNQFWAGGGHGYLELSTNAGGAPLPKAYFSIDATNVWLTNTVNLVNFSKPGYQYKWYVNDVLISNNYHASYTHAMTSGLDSVKLVVTRDGVSDSLTQYQHFQVPPLPTISAFAPQTGSAGTLITIYGANFKDITDVKFGGTSASSFTIVSPEKITAIVGAGASGAITLVHLYGNFAAPGFTYFQPPSTPPPVISSFSPASGPIGTIVTITGHNFDPLPANNIVYFGDTRAIVNTGGATQLTCTVPAGASHKPLFVLNTATHLSGQSQQPFITTFADSVTYFTGKSFTQAHTIYYPNNAGIKNATSADMDNDGKSDIVATLSVWNQDTIVVYRNTTNNNSFSFAERFTVGPLFSKLATGKLHTFDIDGDGLPEILGATNTADITLYRNTSVAGNISFAAPISIPTNEGTQDIKVSDLDGDGKPDLVVVGYTGTSAVSIIRNTSSPGHISFAPVINYSFNSAFHLTIGDIDNDGKNDIVVLADQGLNYGVSVFKNNSTPGSFSLMRTDLTSNAGTGGGIMLADMDRDNKLDIVIKLTDKYLIARNTGTTGNASFDFSTRSTVIGGAAVESLSGDSYPDVVAGPEVFLNSSIPGTIQQAAAVTMAGQNYGSVTHTADFNNDGKADVLMASWASSNSTISIFKNGVGVPIDFSICSGNTVIEADINGNNYQWQQDDGSGFVALNDNSNFAGVNSNKLTLSNVPAAWAGYKYRCLVNGTLYSSTYKIRNKPLPPPVITIGASATDICAGTDITFSAYDNSGQTATSYRWQLNGGDDYTTTPVFAPGASRLPNNSKIRVIGTFRDECFNYAADTSNYIIITVRGELTPVSISTPSAIVCVNSPVTFTATPGKGTDNPVYQWQVNYVNAGTNSPVFTTTSLMNGASVRVLMTSSSACPQSPVATSNTIDLSPQTQEPPAIFISRAPGAVCAGGLLSFSATTTNTTGNRLQYQWKKNGQNVGANSQWYEDRTLVNGDIISVETITYFACADRNVKLIYADTIQVIPAVTPSITITGNTMVDKGKATVIQATATNGGTAPLYVWQDSTRTHGWATIASAGTPSISYTPLATGDKIRCQLTSNERCAVQTNIVSAPLSFTVNIPTGIEPVTAGSGIQLYPNPATTTLIIDSMQLSARWTTLEITNMSGNRIITRNISGQTKLEVGVAGLPKGLYIAVLRQQTGAAFYYKFVKM